MKFNILKLIPTLLYFIFASNIFVNCAHAENESAQAPVQSKADSSTTANQAPAQSNVDSSSTGDDIDGFVSLGMRNVNWGSSDQTIATDQNTNSTAEFSLKYRNNIFVNVFLENVNQSVSNSTDQSSRIGMKLGLGDWYITTESGNIVSYVSAAPVGYTLAYADIGTSAGQFTELGIFRRFEDSKARGERTSTSYGVLTIHRQNAQLWRFGDNSVTCNTLNRYCFFTDRNTVSDYFLLAMRSEIVPFNESGWSNGIYNRMVVGLGTVDTQAGSTALSAAANAKRIVFTSPSVSGIGAYVEGEVGYMLSFKSSKYSWGVLPGAYYRLVGLLSADSTASNYDLRPISNTSGNLGAGQLDLGYFFRVVANF